MNGINDLTVMITGGGSGIGLAAARLFYQRGYRVFLLGRRKEIIDAAVASLGGESSRIRGYSADVSDVSAIKSLFSAWADEGVSPDILINNAGVVTPIAHLADTPPADWLEGMKINLFGPYLCCREAIPFMLEKGGGTIVNISSGAAHHPLEGWSAYCSSKAGLMMLSACLHEEYGGRGIRVFSYRPGSVDTPMQGTIRASGINRVSRIKREDLLSPDISVRGILYLATRGDEGYRGQDVDIRDREFYRKAMEENHE